MKRFFDTSVLIAAFIEDHQHHERSLTAFSSAIRRTDFCAAHSMAEVYATMTRLPGRHRLSGEQVLLFLDDIRERLTLVALSGEQYYAAIRESAEAGITGGTLYDAIIARCALKAKAEKIYTWNTKHFQQCGAGVADLLTTP